MSGQQSMFVDPEHQDSEQRTQNIDPREQEGYGERSTMYGGEEYYQGQSNEGKILPQQAKKPRLLPLIVLLFVLGMFMFGGFSYFAMHRGNTSSAPPFQQQSRATLLAGEKILIQGNTSDVHVHTISGSDVLVSATGKNNLVNLRQEGGEMIISINDEGGMFGNSPNIDVMIPQQSGEALQVESSSGKVDLKDINGPVQVTTNSGDIQVQNLNGSSTLQSTSGDITVEGMTGSAQITTSSGDVDVSQANLDGSSVVNTNSGSITYRGVLNANVPYHFSTSSGDVKLNLDGSPALKVEANTQSGNVHNEFGTGPGNVQISTSSGDIEVHSGS